MRPGIMDFPDIDRATLASIEGQWSPNERALARAGFDPFVTPRHMDQFHGQEFFRAYDNIVTALRTYAREWGVTWLNLGQIRDLTLHSEEYLRASLTRLTEPCIDGNRDILVRKVMRRVEGPSDAYHITTEYQYAGPL